MYLDYGVNDSGELVYVEQVARGATTLRCPYCGGLLLAKKGTIKAHHFAHAGQTCRQVERDDDTLALPCYDNFNLHLPSKVLKELMDFAAGNLYHSERLERYELIQFNRFARGGRGEYELTKKGKIPPGELSLTLFNDFQEPLILAKHDELETRAGEVYERPKNYPAEIDRLREQIALLDSGDYSGMRALRDSMAERARQQLDDYTHKIQTADVDLQTALTDLRLYRAQLRRLLSCSLYFLAIDDGKLYKIGVTTRDIAERVDEIAADLAPIMGKVKIDVLGTWQARGNVELYFKHRYKAHNKPIGALTEYFQFDDAKAVIADLRRMKPKEMTELERAILAGEPSPLERTIYLEEVEARRRAGIRAGLAKAASRGQPIGRPAETDEAVLAKHSAVTEALSHGLSLRQAAKAAGVSVNTVRKVKARLE